MNRRRFILSLLCAPAVASAARPSRASDLSPFSKAWETIKRSLETQWQDWLRVNERVKLHRDGTSDASIAEIAERIIRENKVQETGLKALARG